MKDYKLSLNRTMNNFWNMKRSYRITINLAGKMNLYRIK